jgi:hypothetical protein
MLGLPGLMGVGGHSQASSTPAFQPPDYAIGAKEGKDLENGRKPVLSPRITQITAKFKELLLDIEPLF